jgi:hypothetical protein
MGTILDREEYIEQSYFFRVLRQRSQENLPTQEILDRVHEEILSTTRLPYAIQFMAAELRHSGLLSSGFQRLLHYFAPFQAFIIQQTEDEKRRFQVDTALLVLEREAKYRAGAISPAGLFVYQFETLSRNRLGYLDGLDAMQEDPVYDTDWRAFLGMLRKQIGIIDFAELLYLRSELYVAEYRRRDAAFSPSLPPLFGEKEGKIAKANRGRDPLFLFAALQRQLGYPEVPRPKAPDDISNKFETLKAKMRELEARLKLVEGEMRGHVDLSQYMAKPELLPKPPGDDEI